MREIVCRVRVQLRAYKFYLEVTYNAVNTTCNHVSFQPDCSILELPTYLNYQKALFPMIKLRTQ